MAIETFAFNPPTGFKDATAFPDPANETAAREQLQSLLDQIKDYVNTKVKDVLNSTTDGASGGDNVSMTAITALGEAITMQAMAERLVERIQSTVDGASGADFTGATAISGLTGTTIQALLEALKGYIDTKDTAQTSALNTHKSSSDHDGRYYTEIESDAKYATRTEVQNVVLGQIPSDSLTELKMASDMKKDVEGGVASYNALAAHQADYTTLLANYNSYVADKKFLDLRGCRFIG